MGLIRAVELLETTRLCFNHLTRSSFNRKVFVLPKIFWRKLFAHFGSCPLDSETDNSVLYAKTAWPAEDLEKVEKVRSWTKQTR